MKKSITIVTLAAALSACCVPVVGQTIYKVNTQMNLTGVNNDGVAVGFRTKILLIICGEPLRKGQTRVLKILSLLAVLDLVMVLEEMAAFQMTERLFLL